MQHNHAGQLLDVFQPDEIQSLLSALTKLNNAPNLGDQFKAYTNGFQPTDLIYPFIKRKVLLKLETLFGRPINLVHGMLLKEQKQKTYNNKGVF